MLDVWCRLGHWRKKGEQKLFPFVRIQGADSSSNLKLQIRLVRTSLMLMRDLKEYMWFHRHSWLGLKCLWGIFWIRVGFCLGFGGAFRFFRGGWGGGGVVFLFFFLWWNLSTLDYCSCHLSQWFLKGSGKYRAATDGYAHAFLCWVGFLLLSNLYPQLLLRGKKYLLMRFLYCFHQ